MSHHDRGRDRSAGNGTRSRCAGGGHRASDRPGRGPSRGPVRTAIAPPDGGQGDRNRPSRPPESGIPTLQGSLGGPKMARSPLPTGARRAEPTVTAAGIGHPDAPGTPRRPENGEITPPDGGQEGRTDRRGRRNRASRRSRDPSGTRKWRDHPSRRGSNTPYRGHSTTRPSPTTTGGSRSVPRTPSHTACSLPAAPASSTVPPLTLSLNSEAPVPLRTSAPPGWTAWFGMGGRHVGIGGRHRRNTQQQLTAQEQGIVDDVDLGPRSAILVVGPCLISSCRDSGRNGPGWREFSPSPKGANHFASLSPGDTSPRIPLTCSRSSSAT